MAVNELAAANFDSMPQSQHLGPSLEGSDSAGVGGLMAYAPYNTPSALAPGVLKEVLRYHYGGDLRAYRSMINDLYGASERDEPRTVGFICTSPERMDHVNPQEVYPEDVVADLIVLQGGAMRTGETAVISLRPEYLRTTDGSVGCVLDRWSSHARRIVFLDRRYETNDSLRRPAYVSVMHGDGAHVVQTTLTDASTKYATARMSFWYAKPPQLERERLPEQWRQVALRVGRLIAYLITSIGQ